MKSVKVAPPPCDKQSPQMLHIVSGAVVSCVVAGDAANSVPWLLFCLSIVRGAERCVIIVSLVSKP